MDELRYATFCALEEVEESLLENYSSREENLLMQIAVYKDSILDELWLIICA